MQKALIKMQFAVFLPKGGRVGQSKAEQELLQFLLSLYPYWGGGTEEGKLEQHTFFKVSRLILLISPFKGARATWKLLPWVLRCRSHILFILLINVTLWLC